MNTNSILYDLKDLDSWRVFVIPPSETEVVVINFNRIKRQMR